MTNDQKAVVLEAAQEMQHNDEWWSEFEFQNTYGICGEWRTCGKSINPIMKIAEEHLIFRRRPKTITVTMPVPADLHIKAATIGQEAIFIYYNTVADRDTALAAIRAEMEKG